ncbi:MAG: FliH/SctL family protein [Granulosicoccus sp.]
MSLLTLFSSAHGWIGTDQRVFAPDEATQAMDAAQQVKNLSRVLENQQKNEASATSDGYRKGYQEGRLQAEARSQDKLAQALLDQQALFDRHLHEQKAQIVELSLEVTRKIAGKVGAEDWLLAQARHAVESMCETSDIALLVHPSILETMSLRLAEQPDSPFSSVQGDPDLSLDACVIESATGRVKLSGETQLRCVRDLLLATSEDPDQAMSDQEADENSQAATRQTA